ncbi:MAG: diphosphomevalonate decarboxylase [Candidatus Schekmanbacteria bacterium]|nr:diphosphomevalonate decarboxylase [Candidatus Schekmanbacteria bacterium]
MPRKVTVRAPANIAFVKYWGARDLDKAIPYQQSISMTLSVCHSICTAEYDPLARTDEVWWLRDDAEPRKPPEAFARGIVDQLDRLREFADLKGAFRVATKNSFPSGTGLASSASGFAALTMAATSAMGLDLQGWELSALARSSGAGSAARSVFGGYVEWPASDSDDRCFARVIAGRDHWDLRDVIAVVEITEKRVSSREGHARAVSSPYFATRQELVFDRLAQVRAAIIGCSIAALGPVLEEEAIDLHVMALTSRPPIFYWKPATLSVLSAVRDLRDAGLAAYATLDAGANVHVICPPEDEPRVAEHLEAVPGVAYLIRDRVGNGPDTRARDLF